MYEQTKLRFSEAIRLGAMLRPQSFDCLFDSVNERSCAIGAAIEAVSGKFLYLSDSAVYRMWPFLAGYGNCPVCRRSGPVLTRIICLNDGHKWTRERIADWVETIEPKEAPEPCVVDEPELVEAAC